MKNKSYEHKRVCVVLEFGLPPYRDFLFKYLDTISKDFCVLHNGEKFESFGSTYKAYRVKSFKIAKFKFYLNFLKFLKNSDIVIASFNFWRPSCWLPMFFVNRKRFILWGHIKGNRDNWFSRWFKSICMKKADIVLSYTVSGKDYAVNTLGISENKVLVLRNTLHVSNAIMCHEERKYFLYVGRVQKRKGLDRVLQALRNIDSKNKVLRIVGDGDYIKELIQLTKELGVESKVEVFPASFDDNVLRDHFKHAIAYVSPNHVGLGVVHAFAYGIPVMTFKDAAHAPEFEYCNKENSFLYHSEDNLAIPIVQLLENPEVSFIKGKAGYDYFKSNLTGEHMKEVFYKALYKEI